MSRDVAVLVGSLRKGSLNRKTAEALAGLAPEGFGLRIVEIGELPLYNQDLDPNPPTQWEQFREAIRPADAVLFVTPEYNRSVPGVLKNALDIASRPYGRGAINGKPAAVISVSPGMYGGAMANHHLRQSLMFLDMPVLQQPEAYLGSVGKMFDESGGVLSDKTRDLLQAFIDRFAEFVEIVVRGREATSA